MNNKLNSILEEKKHNYQEPAIKIDKKEFIKLVKSRRSVRVFSDEDVNSNDIKQCLELSLLAPTSSNLQCWEFYWVKNKSKKEKLKEFCLNQSAAKTAKELIVCVARIDTWKTNRNKIISINNQSGISVKYYKKIVPIVYTQGLFGIVGLLKKILIFFIGIFKVIPREPTSKSDMRVWAHKTTALACQNLMLSIRAYGYDTCPMEGMDSKRIKKMLNLGNGAEINMVISVGKRANNGVYGKRFRLNSDNFIKII
ncbi:MAG: nitroreductase family protein [Candidatus Marinimicrobia bacterium]|nr:nitroreductase family protein [Candidatus Neomarinimicrobiota bacterium]|tara:strand:- start:1329 stop:2090 length:762 start_codon:yes stop_codon:yes gene_type:complete